MKEKRNPECTELTAATKQTADILVVANNVPREYRLILLAEIFEILTERMKRTEIIN